MRKLVLSKEIENEHSEYYEKNILPNLKHELNNKIEIKINNNSVDEHLLLINHEKFINKCIKEYKLLAIGKPDKLKEFEEDIADYKNILFTEDFNVNYKYKYRNQLIQKAISYNEYLLKLFGYSKFSDTSLKNTDNTITFYNYNKDKDSFKGKWNAYSLVLSSQVRVCPYCNRNYITPLYSMKKGHSYKLRADLDHFFPKEKYPYFSMSLYNLVPCCKFCNSSLKGTKEFDINDVNPYEDNFGDYFKFKSDILENLRVNIEKTKVNDKSIDNFLSIFPLEDLYNYHTNQVEELVDRKIIYSESYIDELYDICKDYFSSKEQMKQIIIGYIKDKEHLNDEAFAKFRRDIAEQLGFIGYDIPKDILNKLKEKMKNLK